MQKRNYNFLNQAQDLLLHSFIWMFILLYSSFQFIQYDTVRFIEEQLSVDQTEISFDLDENLLAEQGVEVFDAEFYTNQTIFAQSVIPAEEEAEEINAFYNLDLSLIIQDILSPPPRI
jgi:uncharacterized protein YciU (UPF0263 family)